MTAPVKEGDILAGKYRVERILGVGGMGVVVAAMHLELDERVAIKFLLPEALDGVDAVERFAREARAAVKIKSEHVARVIDVGKLDSGSPYMVMEHLEGQDLSDALEKRGPLPVQEAVDYLLQACEAIAEAHSIGIVHRDLKPGNLFLAKRSDGSPIIKVLDFGISKVTTQSARTELSLTKTSTIMGSPLYMSPEQLRSAKDADPRSDVWALGVILHELVTGKVAFEAESLSELCVKISIDDLVPMTSHRSDIPRGLEIVIRTCLSKSPRDRYKSIGELATALVDFAPKRSRLSLERIHGVLEKAGMSTSTLSSVPSSGPSASALSSAESENASLREPVLVAKVGSAKGEKGDDEPRAVPAGTMASWGTGKRSAAKPSRAGAIIGAAIGVVVVGGGTLIFLSTHNAAEPVAASASSSPTTATVASTSTPIPSVTAATTNAGAPPPTDQPTVEPAPSSSVATASTTTPTALPHAGAKPAGPRAPTTAKPQTPPHTHPQAGLFDDPK